VDHKVDSSQNITEYDEETQGVIRKLMAEQRMKTADVSTTLLPADYS
jgi:hypothetical protein